MLALVGHFVPALLEGLQGGLDILWLLCVGFHFVIARQTSQGCEVQPALQFPEAAGLLGPVQLPERLFQFLKFYFLEDVLLQLLKVGGDKFAELVLFQQQIARKKGYL